MIVSESGQLGVGVGCEMWMWTRKAAVLVDEVEPRTKYRKWSRVVCMQRESLSLRARVDKEIEPEKKVLLQQVSTKCVPYTPGVGEASLLRKE